MQLRYPSGLGSKVFPEDVVTTKYGPVAPIAIVSITASGFRELIYVASKISSPLHTHSWPSTFLAILSLSVVVEAAAMPTADRTAAAAATADRTTVTDRAMAPMAPVATAIPLPAGPGLTQVVQLETNQ